MMTWAQFWLLVAAIYISPGITEWVRVLITIYALAMGLYMGRRGE